LIPFHESFTLVFPLCPFPVLSIGSPLGASLLISPLLRRGLRPFALPGTLHLHSSLLPISLSCARLSTEPIPPPCAAANSIAIADQSPRLHPRCAPSTRSPPKMSSGRRPGGRESYNPRSEFPSTVPPATGLDF
jgi:hypothetical protein